MAHDSKTHEKARLKGESGLRRWLTTMPLSPGGIDRNALYLRDFALVVANLGCGPGSQVLEIGAGSCWASEWLGRLGYRAVASDINDDMLRIGRERLEAHRRALPDFKLATWLVSADGESLPFKDESFESVFCLQSLHHIPSIRAAIKDIFRVLKKGGHFVFVEPGEGHAATSASRREMEELGVLEQDILVEEVWSLVHSAGFDEIRLCPTLDLSTGLSIEEWRQLQHRWRHWRLARKWSSVLARTSRLHPGMVCAKPGVEKYAHHTAGQIVAVTIPEVVAPFQVLQVEARVRNTGSSTWQSFPTYLANKPLNQGEGGFVALGFKLRRADGTYHSRDFGRGQLAADVFPGEEASITAYLRAPREPGSYSLKVDLVQESVSWFEDWGSTPLARGFEVSSVLKPAVPDTCFPDQLAAELLLRSFENNGSLVVQVRNIGNTRWLREPAQADSPANRHGSVSLGIQVLDIGRMTLQKDFQRVYLPVDIAPSEQVEMAFSLNPRSLPAGAAFLKLDMVDEGITWFEAGGSQPLILPLPFREG